MSKERYQLHPIAAVVNFIKGLKDLIFPFIIIFVANGFQGGSASPGHWTSYIPYIIGTVILAFVLISGIIKWKRFVYWFNEDELCIEYGLFVKKKRYIPFERIQSLNYTEGLLHRPFKLVKITIETAGSGASTEAEAELIAITRDAAKQIETEIASAQKRKSLKTSDIAAIDEHTVEEQIKSIPIFRMTMKDLLILATTSGGIGVVLSGLVVFLTQFSELIPYEQIYDEVVVFLKFGFFLVVITIFAFVLVGWIISVILTTLNYYQFTIVQEEDQIVLTRGLLEKKKVTIPISRVQGIRIIESPFRQMFGYCTVIVESAGGSMEDQDKKIRLFPLIKKKKIKEPLNKLFSDFDFEPKWTTAPKNAKPFYYRLDFLWVIPVMVGVSYFYYPYGLLSMLLIPIILLLGLWQHGAAGLALTRNQLSIRYRGINKYTFFIEKKRMQSLEMKQSPFQKRKALASIETTIKSGILGATVKVEHLKEEDIEAVMTWYEPIKITTEKGHPE
ncbi:PH domain-containing protein [Paenisporosarcina sp. TG20]|uniref:PH domain-containing protein n=1 Tax=Paenisporosarcina sp. TG20 TaxID=1211706 RepID=UPI00030C2924|nr:PH domain-containing protein [Paenisporosarcina sp. TG20]